MAKHPRRGTKFHMTSEGRAASSWCLNLYNRQGCTKLWRRGRAPQVAEMAHTRAMWQEILSCLEVGEVWNVGRREMIAKARVKS